MADIPDSSPSEKSLPDLEPRQARHVHIARARVETKQRYGEIYLIERQAIELRRLRWAQIPKETQEAEGQPPDTRAFERSWRESAPPASTPSPRDGLARYERPRPDPSRSRADKRFFARAAVWLRQTLLGE